jgi:RNA polymerase sigma-70 factor (ECF subfamily)
MDAESRLLLLQQVRQGHRGALGQLLESLRPDLRVIVHSQRGERHLPAKDDSDLIQDAMVQASENVATFQGTTLGEWLAWLRTITVRTTSRALKSARYSSLDNQPYVDIATLVTVKTCDPSAEAVQRENANRITLALSRLPDDMQQVLLGRLVDDLDHAELAARLGRSAGAVRMLYLRALRKLRDVWQTEFSSAPGDQS